MILGLGVDMVDIRRVDRVYRRFGEGLARRLLADSEQAAYAASSDGARFLAKRFAAKEAAAKALGTGIAGGIRFSDFRVEHADNGAPRLSLQGIALRRAEALGVARTHLSLSDEREQVVACVILEGD